MVSKGARSTARMVGGLVAFAAILACPATATEADNPCQAPYATVANAAPLPHVQALLPAGKPIRVLAIGSSSTVGVGASSVKASYPARLSVELGRTFTNLDVINRGVSGERADATAERIKREVALTKPDLVLWQVGVNDALARVPVDDFARTVGHTLTWLKEMNVDVVLVGMQYTKALSRDEHYKRVRDALKQAAQEANAPLIKRYEAMQHIAEARAGLSLVSEDGLHLNDLGYRCMAEHVASGIFASISTKSGTRGLSASAR